MKHVWIQVTLNQKQFQKIDKWLYEFVKAGELDPLKKFPYCVVIKSRAGLNREVIFSPNSFPLLREIHEDLKSIQTKTIPQPVSSDSKDEKPVVFWFGDLHYFFKIFPVRTEES